MGFSTIHVIRPPLRSISAAVTRLERTVTILGPHTPCGALPSAQDVPIPSTSDSPCPRPAWLSNPALQHGVADSPRGGGKQSILGPVKSSVDAIIGFVRREHNLLLGRRTAAEIVRVLLRNYVDEADLFAEVRGRDLATGCPRTIVVGRDELRGAVRRS